MTKQFTKIISIIILFTISGCSLTIDGSDYEQQAPQFDLVEFFDGNGLGDCPKSFG